MIQNIYRANCSNDEIHSISQCTLSKGASVPYLTVQFTVYLFILFDCLLRLIGIHPNPGPGEEKKSGHKAVRHPPLPPIPSKKKQKQQQKRKNIQKAAALPPATDGYVRALVDPQNNPPCKSGFMTYSPTLEVQPYTKNSGILPGAPIVTPTTFADGFTFTVNPDASLSSISAAPTATVISQLMNNFLTVRYFAGSTMIINAAYPAVNQANCVNSIQSNRTNASGLEVIVAHATTATPGICGVTRLNGITTLTALDNYTPAMFMALPGSKTFTTVGGSATLKCNWLPSDATDFEFANNTVSNNGEGLYNPYVIWGTGFPAGNSLVPNAGSRIYWDLVTHLEGQGGIQVVGDIIPNQLAGGGDESKRPQLIDEHSGSDAFMRKTRDLISHASTQVEFATTKMSDLDDIISKGTYLYHQVGKGYKALNGFLENSKFFTPLRKGF